MKIKQISAIFLAGILFTGTLCSNGVSAARSKAPSPSSLSSDSAIVMELSTGTILYKKNIHKHHYPASITKIMTTLLTLENTSLSEVVTYSEDAVYGIESGSSTISTKTGEKLTIEQSLYAIMLESSNETCLGVGEHIAGSKKKFANMMNERVKSLNLKNTHFVNPNGLHDDNHYTSAYDMAKISKEAWKNTTFRKITGTKSYTLPKTNKTKEVRYLRNHQQMLNGYDWPQYEYKYCIGGKTGYTSMAQSTLVTFAEKNGMQLVAVIMKGNGPRQGQPNEYTDSARILNYAFENYKKHTIDEESNTVNENLFNTFDSYFNTEESPINLAAESAVVLPKGIKLSKAKQKITYNKDITLTEGENIIGQVTYTYNNQVVGATDIIYNYTKNASYLDQESREIVNSEIQHIESKNARKSGIFRKLSGIQMKIATAFSSITEFFKDKIILLLAIVLIIILLILIIAHFLISSKSHRRRGYSSRGQQKGFRFRRKPAKGSSFSMKRSRNKRGTDYTTNRSTSKKVREKRSPGMNTRKQKKNSKRTRESFGKNYFDF